jgi:hypothetical protein
MRLHPHEVEGRLRPVREGDVSSIPFPNEKESTFHLSDFDFFEDDYLKVKDLTQPNTLSCNHNHVIQPTTIKSVDCYNSQHRRAMSGVDSDASISAPIQSSFAVNDFVLFEDPDTHQESYGRIICEWDLR